MSPVEEPRVTVEEYLRLDDASETPLEYIDGYVVPVDSASSTHARLSARLMRYIDIELEGASCRVFDSIRLRVTATKYFHPDVTVACGKLQYMDGRRDGIVNPRLLIEILSPSTEATDATVKFKYYRGLPSLDEYALVWQSEPHVDVYRRKGSFWVFEAVDGLDSALRLESIGVTIALADLYRGVFDE